MNAVEVLKIWIAALFLADPDEVNRAGRLVDAQHLRDIAVTMGNLVLELAGREVVEIEIAPVIALAEPENLVRLWQIMPIDHVVAALVKLRNRLAHHLANFSSRGV